MRHCACDFAKSRAPLFIYLIFISSVTVTVSFKVRVRVLVNNSHVAQSRTASYLATRHIWHDTGNATLLWPYGVFTIAGRYADRHGVTGHGEAISHHVCGPHGVVTA